MNVFGHDHITVDAKFETEAHTLQRGLENLPGDVEPNFFPIR
jgi:hypothetical protein